MADIEYILVDSKRYKKHTELIEQNRTNEGVFLR